MTQAKIQRSLRAANKHGTPVQSITHFPDGRVVLSLVATDAANPSTEWDE